MNTNEDYLPYLQGIKKIKNGYVSLCPFHDDSHQSFSISNGLFHCFACKASGNFDIFLKKLGVEDTTHEVEMHRENGLDKKEGATIIKYEYYNLDGENVYTKIRMENIENDIPKKTFTIDKKAKFNGIIFYNIQDLKKRSDEIWIAEGEKCVEALKKVAPPEASIIGYISWDAEWKEEYNRFFDKKKVIIFEDNDNTGRSNTKKIVNTLKGLVANIRLVEFQDSSTHYDIADFLETNDADTFDLLYEDAEYIYYPVITSTILINGASVLNENIPEPIIIAKDILDIPRGVVGLIASRGGQGKSLLSLYTACGLSLHHINTTILALEDNVNYMRLRLQRIIRKFYADRAAYINISIARISLSTIVQESEWTPAGVIFIKTLENLLKSQKVIFVDPVGGLLGDENSSTNTQKIMQKFQYLSEKYDANIILIHHTRKGGYEDQNSYDVVRGSSALFDNARWVALVNRDGLNLNIRIIKNNFYTIKNNRVQDIFDI